MSDSTARPTFTLTTAAHAANVSRRTISRMVIDGRIAGAWKTGKEWTIPLEALQAAGLRLYAPSPPDAPPPLGTTEPVAELALLRAEIARLSHRAELAEMETELLRTNLDDLRSVIAKLPPAIEAGRPRRWFRR